MTPVSGYLGAIAANGPVSLMVPSAITTAPAWITPDTPRRASVITYAPRMMMVSVIALHTLAISSPAVASPDELFRRGLTYTRCCGKNRQEQYADHGPCERGRGPLSPPAGRRREKRAHGHDHTHHESSHRLGALLWSFLPLEAASPKGLTTGGVLTQLLEEWSQRVEFRTKASPVTGFQLLHGAVVVAQRLGNDCAILVQGDEGPAQVVWLGH